MFTDALEPLYTNMCAGVVSCSTTETVGYVDMFEGVVEVLEGEYANRTAFPPD